MTIVQNVKETLSHPVTASRQKRMMVFIMVLSLSGVENTVAELIPQVSMGPFELNVSSFIFLPLSLAFLFPYVEAAVAVPLGEVVFTDILLGDFSGIGGFSDVVAISAFVYVAAQMIHDLSDRTQVFLAAVFAKIGSEIPLALLDMGKIWVGAESLEAVPGLPESIVIIEIVDLIPEAIITGLIFGAIPAMYLVPALHEKIEPLMGLRPRPTSDRGMLSEIGLAHLGLLVLSSILAFFLTTSGYFLSLPFQ